MRASRVLAGGLLCLFAAAAIAQEKPEAAEREPLRPPEGTIIINLPSAEVNSPQTLQFLVSHRFQQAIEGSTIHTLFSFDSAADLGLGLSYVPVKNLEVGFLRNGILEDYELSAKYAFLPPGQSPVGFALRLGGDARTQSIPTLCETSPRPTGCSFADHRFSFFAQAIGAITLFSRVRITAVPTYVSYSAQQRFVVTESVHKDIVNVPVAAAIAVTRSINIQGEVTPRLSRAASGGVAWIVAIEKTVLRHRFSFTVGNLRPTTVDQVVGADFSGRPRDYYMGFNIIRQWKL